MSNRGWQGGSSSRLSTCVYLLHLQANLPSVVGPAQVLGVLRGPPAGLHRPRRPQTPQGFNVSLDCLDYCTGYAFLESLTVHHSPPQLLDLGTADFHLVLEVSKD